MELGNHSRSKTSPRQAAHDGSPIPHSRDTFSRSTGCEQELCSQLLQGLRLRNPFLGQGLKLPRLKLLYPCCRAHPSPLSIPYLPEQRPLASCRTLGAGSFPKELITALQEREELGVRGEGAAQHLLPGRAMLPEPKFSLKNIPQNNDPPAEQQNPPAAAGAPPEKRRLFEVSMI